MMSKIKLVALFAMIFLQLAVPIYLILSSEFVLSKGTLIKVRVEPVDPYDIFRGRFIALSPIGFRNRDVPEEDRDLLFMQGRVFASIAVVNGFASIDHIYTDTSFLNLWLQMSVDRDGHLINPFDRFYVNQKVAPELESAFRAEAWDSDDTYITVRLKNGKGVIEGLFIGGRSVEELIRELGQK